MIHTQLVMDALSKLDRRKPPSFWPDYLPAPAPACRSIWKSDKQYMRDLTPTKLGKVNPIAALAHDMQDTHWEDQLVSAYSKGVGSTNISYVQHTYRNFYIAWVRALRAEEQRSKFYREQAIIRKQSEERRAGARGVWPA